ncbi:MAG: hypothetical protein R3E53_00475 [Myxococcota bacterium]
MNRWDWEETQSEQSAVLDYLEHVADRFDLRRDIQFETWVTDARYDESAQRWTIETDKGVRARAPFVICALGALSEGEPARHSGSTSRARPTTRASGRTEATSPSRASASP